METDDGYDPEVWRQLCQDWRWPASTFHKPTAARGSPSPNSASSSRRWAERSTAARTSRRRSSRQPRSSKPAPKTTRRSDYPLSPPATVWRHWRSPNAVAGGTWTRWGSLPTTAGSPAARATWWTAASLTCCWSSRENRVRTGTDGLSLYAVDATAAGVSRTPLKALDPTRKLARITLDGANGRVVGKQGEAGPALARALDLANAALANEMVGGAARLLDSARRLRQGARPVRPRHRLLPGRQASPGGPDAHRRACQVGGLPSRQRRRRQP